MKTFQELYIEQCGVPNEVLAIREVKSRNLAENEVRLRVLAAPINPADLNFIEGVYGIKAQLPSVIGFEGVAEVLESTSDRFSPGDRVIPIAQIGTWREEAVVSADVIARIPSDCDVLQAAMLKINPATAWCLLNTIMPLEEGDWIVQNAANSSVGQCVIQLAKLKGIRTINMVRREELIDGLRGLGGDIVVLDERAAKDDILAATNQQRPKLALNAVGGDSALLQLDLLASGGTQVTYGAMSRRSLKVPNSMLIFKDLTLRGFWLSSYFKAKPMREITEIYEQLAALIREGKLFQNIDSTYHLAAFREAVMRANECQRSGKVLFDFR